MYAVIEVGGKQYMVSKGDRIKVEKMDVPEDQEVSFDALFVKKDDGSVEFGKGKVKAKVIAHGKHKKIIVFKYKPKKNYKRWKGHRQLYTEIGIEEIEV